MRSLKGILLRQTMSFEPLHVFAQIRLCAFVKIINVMNYAIFSAYT
jgi:hypothetical protein